MFWYHKRDVEHYCTVEIECPYCGSKTVEIMREVQFSVISLIFVYWTSWPFVGKCESCHEIMDIKDQQSVIDCLRTEGYKIIPSYWKRNIISLLTIPVIGIFAICGFFIVLSAIGRSIT